MKIFNLKKRQKGTTIIELLIYIAILSIFLTMLTSVFVSALDVQSESQATSSTQQDGNYILARLNYDIHRAQSISIPAVIGDTTNNFRIMIDGESYLYSVDTNNNLVLANNSGINNLNSYDSSISSFSVRRLGNPGGAEDSLRISFTITSKTQRASGIETKNFQTNLSLRKK